MRQREEEMKPRERERESRDMKETRAEGERWDDNVRGKLMLRATIRFICALSTMIDTQKAAIWNYCEGRHHITPHTGLNNTTCGGSFIYMMSLWQLAVIQRNMTWVLTEVFKPWWLYHITYALMVSWMCYWVKQNLTSQCGRRAGKRYCHNLVPFATRGHRGSNTLIQLRGC